MIKDILPTIHKTLSLYATCKHHLENPEIPIRQKKALINQMGHLERKLKDLRNKIDTQVGQPICKVILLEDNLQVCKWFPGFTETDVKLYYQLIPTKKVTSIVKIERIQ